MAGRDRHPKKDVEKAIEHAEDERWTVEVTHSGHVWGVIFCPARICFLRVSSTPKTKETRPSESAASLTGATTRRRTDDGV
jgi:hypothetical protein